MSKPAPQKIVLVPIDSLTPDPDNVRLHGEENIKAIADSIQQFGFQGAVIVDGDNVVRAGNGTIEAARKLGLTLAPVIRTDLTGDRAKAFAIAHNRSAELAQWDEVKLRDQLAALRETHPAGGLGFDSAALRKLGASAGGGHEMADAEPQLHIAEQLAAKWGTKLGQLWEIRSKRWVYCPKCRKLHTVENH